jgi:hypothetical protein
MVIQPSELHSITKSLKYDVCEFAIDRFWARAELSFLRKRNDTVASKCALKEVTTLTHFLALIERYLCSTVTAAHAAEFHHFGRFRNREAEQTII